MVPLTILAREENISGVSSEKLAVAINELGTKTTVVNNPEEAVGVIKNKIYQDKGGAEIINNNWTGIQSNKYMGPMTNTCPAIFEGAIMRIEE